MEVFRYSSTLSLLTVPVKVLRIRLLKRLMRYLTRRLVDVSQDVIITKMTVVLFVV
jgi:hypothetical protein